MKKPNNPQQKSNQSGFSLLELLAVMVIIAIAAGVSIFYLYAHTRLYKVEDQALKIIDILQEAKQRAITQRETIRVELNTTQNAIILIDENKAGDSDDKEIKRLRLETGEIRIGQRPANISVEPSEPTPVPQPVFAPSSHPLTQGNSVAVLRFTSTGVVMNGGVNSVGGGAVMTGMTVYVWKPRQGSTTNADMTRGVTVLGPSGTIRLWNYNHTGGTPVWQTRQ